MFLQNMDQYRYGKINVHSLFVPLLAFNATFSSKPIFPDILLHLILSNSLIIVSMIIFYQACKNKVIAISIPALVIVLRLARYGEAGESILSTIYFVPYSILFIVVGTKLFKDYPVLVAKQIVAICVISITLSFLQIIGVQSAQSLTNFYYKTGGTSNFYLFVNWDNLPEIETIQVRPVGFSQANNVVSQYLLFFYAYVAGLYLKAERYLRPPLFWLFIISLAGALTGAKVVIASIIFVNLALFILCNRVKMAIKISIVSSSAYAIYYLIFPGLFVYNFNIDLFAFNAMVRVKHMMLSGGYEYLSWVISVLSEFNTGQYIGNKSVDEAVATIKDVNITGIGTIVEYLRYIIPVILIAVPFWAYKLKLLPVHLYINIKRTPILMGLASLASTAGGPFIFTPYYWFFSSVVLFPITLKLIKDSYQKTTM